MKIVIRLEANRYKACVDGGESSSCGVGQTAKEALGDLIYICQKHFGIEVEVIQPKVKPMAELRKMFELIGDFHEGLAIASHGDGLWFHIFPDGTPAYEERYEFVSSFCRGTALVAKDKKKGPHFHILPDGTRVD